MGAFVLLLLIAGLLIYFLVIRKDRLAKEYAEELTSSTSSHSLNEPFDIHSLLRFLSYT